MKCLCPITYVAMQKLNKNFRMNRWVVAAEELKLNSKSAKIIAYASTDSYANPTRTQKRTRARLLKLTERKLNVYRTRYLQAYVPKD